MNEIFKFQHGQLYIQVPLDPAALKSIRLVRDVLEFLEGKLMKEEQAQKKTEVNP